MRLAFQHKRKDKATKVDRCYVISALSKPTKQSLSQFTMSGKTRSDIDNKSRDQRRRASSDHLTFGG